VRFAAKIARAGRDAPLSWPTGYFHVLADLNAAGFSTLADAEQQGGKRSPVPYGYRRCAQGRCRSFCIPL
jgi:hypothetical protein